MQQNPNDPSMVPVRLGKIMKKLHSFADSVLEKHQLSRIHVHYLVFLHGCKKTITAKELSEHLGVDKANTSRAINDLIKRKFVRRIADDSKQLLLELTEAGIQVAIELKEKNQSELDKLVSILSEEEIRTLRTILRKISDTI
ncbi:MAG: MarR family transcriptional regulator [Acholeplasma sp.]|nr:MarR family transcriptional regulator [Acholeplasma sp.]